MRKLLLLLGLLSIVFVTPAFADVLGVRLSGGAFDYSVSGTLRDDPDPANTFDVKTDLGWKDGTSGMAYLYFEHPIPIIPNIRLGVTSLKLGGTGTVTGTYTYNGTTFPINDSVTSNVDLSHTEVALYYEVLDTVVGLDLGVNVKLFNGQASIVDNDNPALTATSNINETIPMLYGALSVQIPGTGFSLLGDFSAISYNDSKITDYLVRVRYDTSFMLGAELGYRSIHIDYQDSGSNQYYKLDAKGPYLMATLSF